MPLPRAEIETVVRIGYNDEVVTVTTGDPKYKRKLESLGLKPVNVSRIAVKWDEREDANGNKVHVKPLEWEDVTWTFEAPADWFKLPRPPKKVSDAQRQATSERMKARFAKDEDDED